MTITNIGERHWTVRGERIESARGFVGFSRRRTAELVTEVLGRRITGQVIYNLEHGERDSGTDELKALAEVLGQPVEWLDADADATFNHEARKDLFPNVFQFLPLGLSAQPIPRAA